MGKVRLGIVGCGNFARGQMNNIVSDGGYDVRIVCDKIADKAETFRKDFDLPRAVTDYQEILAAPDIDAVLVTTEHDSHAEICIAAANAGKHIFCEKPMALNMEQVRNIAEAVNRNQVKYTVGYNRAISPIVTEAAGKISTLSGKTMIYHRIQALFPVDHWTHIPEIGGGRFVGEGCHIFDLFCRMIDSEPVSVYAAGGTYLDEEQVKIPDTAVVTITFADGSVAVTLIHSNGCGTFPKESTEIYRDGKVIQIEDFCSASYYGFEEGRTSTIKLAARDKGHKREVELFRLAVLEDKPAPNGIQIAAKAALISYLTVESIRTGQPMQVNAADWQL
jgi:predicted dehydrogenase